MNTVALPPRSLAERASRHFPSAACLAGFQLFRENRVTLASVSPEGAEAGVKSKRARSVRLRRSGGALGVACSCWPTSTDVGACKHVWAALLTLDRDGGLDALRAEVKPLELVPLPPTVAPPPEKPGPAKAREKTAASAKKKKVPPRKAVAKKATRRA